MRDIVKMTLADQIYNILREDIINQNIRCGEKLTLKSLQERFNISSTPIREAMGRLSLEGLIDHVTNVGAKVIELNEKDIMEIYDFCSLLDVSALKLALQGQKADVVADELNQCVSLQEKALEAGNMEDFKIHSDNFHDIFFKYADNSRLYNASINIRSQFSILTTMYQNHTVAKSVVVVEHRGIAEAVAGKNTEKAAVLMTRHFEHAKSYLLENIKGTTI